MVICYEYISNKDGLKALQIINDLEDILKIKCNL